MHWTDRFTSAGPIDAIVGAATDPISGQPELKATAVRIAPVAAQWWGLLLRGSEHVPHGPYYWARLPLERGHAFTLIGWEALPNGRGTELWITALLDAPPGAELVFYTDPGRGTFRFASVVGSRLDACVFLASGKSGLPSRDAVAALLGTKIEPEMRTLLLAGNPDGPCAARSPGRTICACFGVGLNALHDAIASRRATSIAEIGSTLRAGTNCGSCIPELKAILERERPCPGCGAARAPTLTSRDLLPEGARSGAPLIRDRHKLGVRCGRCFCTVPGLQRIMSSAITPRTVRIGSDLRCSCCTAPATRRRLCLGIPRLSKNRDVRAVAIHGMTPTVLVIIGHALLRERFHLFERTGRVRLLQRKNAHQLVAS